MTDIPELNPSDRWTVRSQARPGKPGEAEVTLWCENEAGVALPATHITADWPEGGELCDAEAWALALYAQSMRCLSQRLLDRAVELRTGA